MKKLLIVVGAGASVQFGMPSVWRIDQLFEEWAQKLAPLQPPHQGNLYSWVKTELKGFVSRNKNNLVDNIVNFESLLYTIQNLGAMAWDMDHQKFANRLNAFSHLRTFPQIEKWGQVKVADGEDFWHLHSRLVDELLDYFRLQCRTLATDKAPELALLRSFLLALSQEYELGVLNLNYDNVMLSALPELRTGFDPNTGDFDRQQLYQDSWNFCYHLHGSVHFDMPTHATQMHKICWNKDLTATFSGNASGRNNNFTTEGIPHLTSGIIAGLDKANQTLNEPFGQFFSQTDRLIYEADAILFLGYGFNDLHLNRKFPFIRFDAAKKRKVVIVDYADDTQIGLRARWDGWAHGLSATIPYNGNEMGTGRYIEPNAAGYYKKKKCMETSANKDFLLSVWYNGMLQACEHPDKILDELRSDVKI